MAEGISDLFSPSAEFKKSRHVFTVTEITQGIKVLLEGAFSEVWVEGEVSNCRPSGAGHVYFSLKDQNAILSSVMFSRQAKDVKFKLEDGLKVICSGSIDVYAPRGQYQLIIERIEPKGIGGLQLALEQLKAKLEKEGIFAPEHKKPIPYLPAKIGVVTSLTGAAIKDILKVLDRRFKDTHIIINPVKVQGDGAKEEISQAIADFNLLNQNLGADEKIEVLIVGRGGGSIEDLWAFNEEIVVRAIYNSRIPVISAVGHERDVTISDLAADLRAATPSVAAELVIPRQEDLRQRLEELTASIKQDFQSALTHFYDEIEGLNHRLKMSLEHIWELNFNRLNANKKKLSLLNPAVKLVQYQDKLLDLARQIYVRINHFLNLKETEFSGIIGNLSSLNPLNILARGYSVTFSFPEGRIVKDAGAVKKGDKIKTKLHKGEIISEIREIKL
ncbi:MAG: exodeoxyribonuclease VII large subunit [Candidatus Omnitrophota bacterium]